MATQTHTRTAEDIGSMLAMLVAKQLKKQGSPGSECFKKGVAQPAIPAKQILSIFKDVLRADEYPLNFDLASLNQHCIWLLRAIQRACLKELPQDYGAEYGIDQTPFNVVAKLVEHMHNTPDGKRSAGYNKLSPKETVKSDIRNQYCVQASTQSLLPRSQTISKRQLRMESTFSTGTCESPRSQKQVVRTRCFNDGVLPAQKYFILYHDQQFRASQT